MNPQTDKFNNIKGDIQCINILQTNTKWFYISNQIIITIERPNADKRNISYLLVTAKIFTS
jgi:hypothetical protein